jgi:hypothetical protein
MNTKQQIRALLISAKVLQFCADIFAVFGVFLFAYLYFNQYSEHPMAAIKDPFFVVTILIPFIPAAVLSLLAARKRKQVRNLIEKGESKS